jgi:uncharacterized protein (DUF1501 family)
MAHSRRDFLVRTTCAALSATALQSSVRKLGLMNLLAQQNVSAPTDYRALVCIFLFGGNDGNNMIIPIDDTNYAAYAAARPVSSGLGFNQGDPLPINTPPSFNGSGWQFGFHPNLTELQGLFDQNKLAVVSNVGPLVYPMTQADYMNNSVAKPYALFSHSDQQTIWQTAQADHTGVNGWGGRTVDATLSFNNGATFPTMTSVTGSAVFCLGLQQRPLSIGTGPLNTVLVLSGFNGSPESTARRSSFDFLRTVDRTATMIAATSDTTQQAVDTSAALTTDPTINTVFPSTSIGDQLLQVAKVIKLNQTSLSLNRQVFFCSLGGFDTHQNQIAVQGGTGVAGLLAELSQAMNAFYLSTVELGVSDRVVTFTLSDFARTLQPSGSPSSVGTDHGWGSHHFVLGDAVTGGDFYGTVGTNGTTFPTLQIGGPDDTTNSLTSGRGRWIPTTAVEQYGSKLATWLGVAAGDLPTVFPNLAHFPDTPGTRLGFLP